MTYTRALCDALLGALFAIALIGSAVAVDLCSMRQEAFAEMQYQYAYEPLHYGYESIFGYETEEKRLYDEETGWDHYLVVVKQPAWMTGEWQPAGTCQWRIVDKVLTIRPANGKQGTLGASFPWTNLGFVSWGVWGLGGSGTAVDRVVVEPGVQATTCKGMFKGFYRAKAFDLSGLDTSQVTDMSDMFEDCMSVKTLNLSQINTSKVTTMRAMLMDCRSLHSVNLSGLNTSAVTDMSYMFQSCESLEKVDLSKLDLTRVKTMARMFAGTDDGMEGGEDWESICDNLKQVIFPAKGTRNVENMEEMFRASGTGALKLTNLDTSSVKSMKRMFFCSPLQTVDVSQFDTARVTDMTEMFAGCNEVTRLDLSSFDTSRVTSMEGMFAPASEYDSGLKKLTSLDVSSFDTHNVMSMAGMFTWCRALKQLDLSSFDTSRVRSMTYMFTGCTALRTIVVSSSFKTNALATTEHYDYSKNPSVFTVKSGYKMFEGCMSLVGGRGTKYSAAHTDQAYARVDAKGKPGYLSPASLAKAKVTVAPRVWSGKKLTPSVTVKLGGRTLKKGTDYKVSWPKASKTKTAKRAGRYTVTVEGVGAYTGKVKASFDVTPAKAAAKKATALGKRSVKVTWAKSSKKKLAQVSGWQVQVALDKKFTKSAKSYTAKKSATSKTVSKLKKGKTYYVHVRAYTKSGKAKVYGPWSKTLKVKVK